MAAVPDAGLDLGDIDLAWPAPRPLQGVPSSFDGLPDIQRRWRALLENGDHSRLEAELAQQDRAAREAGSDRRLEALMSVFGDADLALAPDLDRWVARSPDNLHARLARGLHALERAHEARGTRYARETAEERLEAMRVALATARVEFEHARSLDPGSGLAAAGLIEVERHASTRRVARRFGLLGALAAAATDDAFRRQRAEHLLATAARHPASYAVQHAALWALQPKWGGSRDGMLQLADAAPARAAHPDFALLPSLGACLVADELRLGDRMHDAVSLHAAIASRYGAALHPLCLRERGFAESAMGREEAALQSFRAYAAAAPHDVDAARRIASRLEGLQHDEEAIRVLDAALQRRPSMPALLCQRARLDQRAAALDAARERLERALRQNPLDGQCWMQFGQVMNALGRGAEAEQAATRALALSQDDAGATTELGFALLGMQRWDEAVAALDQAVAQDPDRVSAWYYRGIALLRLQRGADAKASLDRALELRPEHAAAAYQRGLVRAYLLQDLPGAEADLAFATSRAPDLAQAWFELAGVRYRQRDCAFVPALRRYDAACAVQTCLADRVAWMRAKLDDPGLTKLCPDPT